MKYVNPEYKNEVMSSGDIMAFSPLDIGTTNVNCSTVPGVTWDEATGTGTGLFGEAITENTVYIKGTSSADITDLF